VKNSRFEENLAYLEEELDMMIQQQRPKIVQTKPREPVKTEQAKVVKRINPVKVVETNKTLLISISDYYKGIHSHRNWKKEEYSKYRNLSDMSKEDKKLFKKASAIIMSKCGSKSEFNQYFEALKGNKKKKGIAPFKIKFDLKSELNPEITVHFVSKKHLEDAKRMLKRDAKYHKKAMENIEVRSKSKIGKILGVLGLAGILGLGVAYKNECMNFVDRIKAQEEARWKELLSLDSEDMVSKENNFSIEGLNFILEDILLTSSEVNIPRLEYGAGMLEIAREFNLPLNSYDEKTEYAIEMVKTKFLPYESMNRVMSCLKENEIMVGEPSTFNPHGVMKSEHADIVVNNLVDRMVVEYELSKEQAYILVKNAEQNMLKEYKQKMDDRFKKLEDERQR